MIDRTLSDDEVTRQWLAQRGPRFRWNAGRSGDLAVGVRLSLNLWTGLNFMAEVSFLHYFAWFNWQVFWSYKMQLRSWDRWNAECLAGEHKGICVTVEPPR